MPETPLYHEECWSVCMECLADLLQMQLWNLLTRTTHQISLRAGGISCSELGYISSLQAKLVLSVLRHTFLSKEPQTHFYMAD